jgi:hypothetical protein
MKGFIICLILSFSVATGFSQKVYFIYLQSETDQPFFVKLKEKVFSSSSTGYLILSKLKDSTYQFTVGFPMNKYPEQEFKIGMEAKDHGFLLKNLGEKGWALFDLESMALHMALPSAKTSKTELKEVSEFTEILSRASDDPSLKERQVVIKKEEPVIVQPIAVSETETVKEPVKQTVLKETAVVENKEPVLTTVKPDVTKKEESKKEEVKKEIKSEPLTIAKAAPPKNLDDSVAIKTDPPVAMNKETVAEVKPDAKQPKEVKQEAKQEVKQEPKQEEKKPMATPEYASSVVKKKSESSTVDGLGITYIDQYADGKKDTIRIMIPNQRNQSGGKPPAKEDKKFLDITPETKDLTKPSKKEIADSVKRVQAAALPANCNSLATENDFLKLRKKMAAGSNDDAMVGESVKSFKSKCFTVLQVKNLSTLFLNDAGKYKFFDAAYMHVSDAANFSSLQSELKDEYYVNRFKAMMR